MASLLPRYKQIFSIRQDGLFTTGLLLAWLALCFSHCQAPKSSEELFTSNFQVQEQQLTATLKEIQHTGSIDTARLQALATGLSLVEKRQYAEAIPALRDWLLVPPPQPETPVYAYLRAIARFYLAQAFMSIGDTGAATLLLTVVSNDPAFLLPNDARWYLALCQIKNKRPEAARPLLQTVAASTSGYAPPATRLLKQL